MLFKVFLAISQHQEWKNQNISQEPQSWITFWTLQHFKKIPFTTSKAELDIQHKKHNIWSVSRVVERIKALEVVRILGNKEILRESQYCPVSPGEIDFCC